MLDKSSYEQRSRLKPDDPPGELQGNILCKASLSVNRARLPNFLFPTVCLWYAQSTHLYSAMFPAAQAPFSCSVMKVDGDTSSYLFRKFQEAACMRERRCVEHEYLITAIRAAVDFREGCDTAQADCPETGVQAEEGPSHHIDSSSPVSHLVE